MSLDGRIGRLEKSIGPLTWQQLLLLADHALTPERNRLISTSLYALSDSDLACLIAALPPDTSGLDLTALSNERLER